MTESLCDHILQPNITTCSSVFKLYLYLKIPVSEISAATSLQWRRVEFSLLFFLKLDVKSSTAIFLSRNNAVTQEDNLQTSLGTVSLFILRSCGFVK